MSFQGFQRAGFARNFNTWTTNLIFLRACSVKAALAC